MACSYTGKRERAELSLSAVLKADLESVSLYKTSARAIRKREQSWCRSAVTSIATDIWHFPCYKSLWITVNVSVFSLLLSHLIDRSPVKSHSFSSIANIMAACHSQTRLIFPQWSSGKSPLRHAPVPIFGGEPRHILCPYLGRSRPKSVHGGESSCRRRWAVGGASAEPNSIKGGRGIPVKQIDGDQNLKEAKRALTGTRKRESQSITFGNISHDIPCGFFAPYSNRHYAEHRGLQRSGSALRSSVSSGGTIRIPSESTWCWWVHVSI